jgi:hypothetical protein
MVAYCLQLEDNSGFARSDSSVFISLVLDITVICFETALSALYIDKVRERLTLTIIYGSDFSSRSKGYANNYLRALVKWMPGRVIDAGS